MKIGLLLPSVYMADKYKNKIFAPKELFLNLANGLVDKGHDVYVYSAPGTKTKAHLIKGNSDLIERDFISPKFRGLERIMKQKNAHLLSKTEYEMDLCVRAYLNARENKIDIMHSYHGDTFMAHYINRIIHLPTVYTIHDPKPRREHIEYWRLKQFRNDKYILISKSQERHYRNFAKSVGVIYHGVDSKKFAFSKSGGSYLAFIGRYIKEKGVIEAAIAAKEAKIPLKMVGDKAYRVLPYYQTKVLPLLKKGFIEDQTFLGESDRQVFFQNAWALLFPILWEEPFGMVMIEAMSCGTPVIAFNRGSVSEVVKDGETGFIVDPKEGVRGLVRAIKKLQSLSPQEYHLMRVACRVHVEKFFSVNKMVIEHEALYAQILNSKH